MSDILLSILYVKISVTIHLTSESNPIKRKKWFYDRFMLIPYRNLIFAGTIITLLASGILFQLPAYAAPKIVSDPFGLPTSTSTSALAPDTNSQSKSISSSSISITSLSQPLTTIQIIKKSIMFQSSQISIFLKI
ncbi:hypothetical protein DYY65_11940 [Nitrososphaera sp. AFS]|nr:hypothetical protein [Nitrososphaera sp. AFS]